MAQENKISGPIFDKDLAESLIDLEVPRSIKFSPDGQKVVYAAGRAGNVKKGKHYVSALWLASTGMPGSARQLTSGSFGDSSPTWHPDGNRILFLSDRTEAGNKYGVWALRLDGGDATAITPVDVEQSVQKWTLSPDGKTVAYLSADEKTEEEQKKSKEHEAEPDVWGEKWEYARLRLVDVDTKETRTLVCEDRHIKDLSWSRDGKNIALRSDDNTELEEADITGGTISTVNVESGLVKDLCTVKAQFLNLVWAADGRIYFLGVAPVGSLFGGFAVFSVESAHACPSFTRVAYGEEDDAVQVSFVDGKVIAKRDAQLGSIISEVGVDDLFNFPDTEIGDWDVFFNPKTGSASLATTLSTMNEPSEVFVVEKGKDKRRLSDHGKAFKDRTFGTCTVLTCQSADGEVEIQGIYFAPSTKTDANGRAKEPLPTLVSIHGGPSSSDSTGWDVGGRYWSAYALSQGYGVLMPQYRGSSGRGEIFGAYSGRGVGKYDYDDVITLTDYAVKEGFADPTRLLVGGWSQGGYLTYLCSVRNGLHGRGWKFQAGIAGAGITDWDSLCSTSVAGASFQAQMTGGGRAPWRTPSADTTGRQGSALWEMGRAVEEARRRGEMVIPPVLILHGAEDVQCSTSQAVGYHRGARAHGLPCEFVRYPGQGHGITARHLKLDVLERVGKWCWRHIGAGMTG
ncbi:WD40 YVTN repeat-like-containing domain [Cordyceps militaris]|uniref:Dipeptidyl-peptidase V n=1 Tax=Cordyceps militaris TaxID=73501 RepID=A0A2H4S6B6_CORMI|nr:WD40 YVTN repeat-like-containing domain [Cordyceps militaris]